MSTINEVQVLDACNKRSIHRLYQHATSVLRQDVNYLLSPVHDASQLGLLCHQLTEGHWQLCKGFI